MNLSSCNVTLIQHDTGIYLQTSGHFSRHRSYAMGYGFDSDRGNRSYLFPNVHSGSGASQPPVQWRLPLFWGVEKCRCNSTHFYLDVMYISVVSSLGPYGKCILYPSDESLDEFQNCIRCWEEEESLLHIPVIEHRFSGRSDRTQFAIVTDMW